MLTSTHAWPMSDAWWLHTSELTRSVSSLFVHPSTVKAVALMRRRVEKPKKEIPSPKMHETATMVKAHMAEDVTISVSRIACSAAARSMVCAGGGAGDARGVLSTRGAERAADCRGWAGGCPSDGSRSPPGTLCY